MIAEWSAFSFSWWLPEDVSHGADKQVWTAGLYATSIRIEVDVTHWLPAAEPT